MTLTEYINNRDPELCMLYCTIFLQIYTQTTLQHKTPNVTQNWIYAKDEDIIECNNILLNLSLPAKLRIFLDKNHNNMEDIKTTKPNFIKEITAYYYNNLDN